MEIHVATKKELLRQIVTDHRGKLSSKRIITFSAFLLMCLAFVVNIIFEIPMTEFIFNGMVSIVLGGLGVSVAEHFSLGSKKEAPKGDVESPELLEG